MDINKLPLEAQVQGWKEEYEFCNDQNKDYRKNEEKYLTKIKTLQSKIKTLQSKIKNYENKKR